MKLLIRIFVSAILVMLISYLMTGVTVDSFTTSLIVAIVLGLLNLIVKPVLILFTIPVTILTLGLFLLVINAIIILLCDNLVDGFSVNSFWTALFFSIVLTISESIVFKLTDNDWYFPQNSALKYNSLKTWLGCKNFIILQPNFIM